MTTRKATLIGVAPQASFRPTMPGLPLSAPPPSASSSTKPTVVGMVVDRRKIADLVRNSRTENHREGLLEESVNPKYIPSSPVVPREGAESSYSMVFARPSRRRRAV